VATNNFGCGRLFIVNLRLDGALRMQHARQARFNYQTLSLIQFKIPFVQACEQAFGVEID
jgi:hypothetical protein